MASICLYFQLHQPDRLRRYSVFDAHTDYLDDERNGQILRSVTQKCYIPATTLLLNLIHRHDGQFRLAFSLTGCVIEQFKRTTPEVLELFTALAQTGCVEFLSETYHHSLASIYHEDEFRRQVEMHDELIEEHFGQRPAVFRNTELIYHNQLAETVASMGRYRAILAEGADQTLGQRSPDYPYHPPGHPDIALLLRNYHLSDDIAFRFSDRSWPSWPLTAEKFGDAVEAIEGPICNLFLDYETFGEHQHRDTGILDFLDALPAQLLARGSAFLTPSEVIERHASVDEYDVPEITSWADTERDLSAWAGNAMQASALQELYRLHERVAAAGDDMLMRDWRRLTCSDHFYYMCTKYFADAEVHRYFNPYESPYDSYINFMNVLDHLRTRVEGATAKA
ncbi:MAG: glycoside hydrolase family 57 protein [Phycisphaeraceae bacterium]